MIEERANAPFVAKDRGRREVLRSRGVRIAVIALIVLGCTLRTVQYLGQVSLWHDELALVLNVEQKGIRELLTEPLAHRQVAPVGFLAAVAVCSRLLGIDELGVRLVPWLFALASVLVFWRVAERFASGAALVAGMTLFAVSPALIIYGASVKPYAADVAVTLLLILLALRYRERPEDLRAAWVAGVGGGAALLCSYPAVLVAAVVAPILLLAWWRTRPHPPLGPLAAMLGGWSAGAAIATAAALLLRDAGTVAYMRTFWGSRGGFPPPFQEGLAALAWAPRQLFAVFAHFLLFITPPTLVAVVAAPAAALAVVGLAWLWRRFPWSAALLLAPVAAGLLGAFAGLLPFRHRTGLYAGSAVLALSMVGLEALRTLLPPRVRSLVAVVAALVAGPLALIVLLAGRPPYPTQESKPVLQEIARRRQAGDVLYVYCRGRHAIEFYGPRVGLGGWTQGGCHDDVLDFLRELDAFRGQPRLWFFFTQSHGQETTVIRSYLRTIGRERVAIPDPAGYGGEAETAAYLFDLSDPNLLGLVTADSFPLSRAYSR
jgi:dolichyl-phosphate-mannose-protein mannosyltransferase